jgi:hypothetical protein
MAGSHERRGAANRTTDEVFVQNAGKTPVNFAFCRFWLGDMLGKSSL